MASTLRFDNWEDSNGTPILDGTNLALPSSAMPTGSVLQIVNNVSVLNLTTTSTSFQSSGLSASITPKRSTSSILVLCTFNYQINPGPGGEAALFRDGTVDISSGGNGGQLIYDSATSNVHFIVTMHSVDIPSTTNLISYDLKFASYDGAAVVLRNWGKSIITLMEIAG